MSTNIDRSIINAKTDTIAPWNVMFVSYGFVDGAKDAISG
jgi:hypothetical protein